MIYPTYSNWGASAPATAPNGNYVAPPQAPSQIPMNTQQASVQPQNGGLVMVTGEDDVTTYPVAPGYSMAFIDNSFSHLYIKSAGLSQFEPPRTEKYSLVKDGAVNEATPKESPEYALKSDLDKLWTEFKKFRSKGGETK